MQDSWLAVQNQLETYADKHRVEHKFEIGDLVYLQLQPYRQSSLKKSNVGKLNSLFYRPYRIIRRVGKVTYELELPESSKKDSVFHVSCLKKALGRRVTSSSDLSALDEEGHLVLILEEIVDTQEKRLRDGVVKRYLVRWRGLTTEDATWEDEQIL